MEGQPICVYKNKDYVGDAWLVYDYIECSSEMPLEEQFAIINEPQFSVKDTVLVETDTETEALLQKVSQKDKNAIVQLIKYTNNSIELHICTANAGILVMAESDVKGWKVYVDEEEQKILSVNYANRGVLVDAGEHDIRMIYSPNSYRIGKIITVVTVLICVMAIIIISCKSKMRKNGNLI
jgi:Predicted membrane protein